MNEKIIKWTITDRQKMHQIWQTDHNTNTNKQKKKKGENKTDRETDRQIRRKP